MARIDDLHDDRLHTMRKMVSNEIAVAVPSALNYCHQYKRPVPDWLLEAAIELLCTLLKNEKTHRRGRAQTHIARYRQDNIDYTRWSTVDEHRRFQQEILEQVESLRQETDSDWAEYRKDRELLQKWCGTTLNRAFECAAMMLEGTEAFGSPEAIKRSYFKVRRNLRDPDKTVRYSLLEPMFLHTRLGIKWEPFVRPGRKIEPLYNLTL